MLFFRRKKQSDIDELLFVIEKLGKITFKKTQRKDVNSVLKNLKWFDNHFQKLIQLREKNFEKFKFLIDPYGIYKKVEFTGSIDWSKVDFSKVKIEKRVTEPSKEYPYPKKYMTDDIVDEEMRKDTFRKYIQVIFGIWDEANTQELYRISQMCIYVYANWISLLDKQADDKIDFQAVLKYFLKNFSIINNTILASVDKPLHPQFRFVSFNFYLNQIFSEDVNRNNISLYFDFLLSSILSSIARKRNKVVQEFIERCIESTYFPVTDLNIYTELYDFLPKEHSSQERRNDVLDLAFNQIRYLSDMKEFEDWQGKLGEFTQKYLRDENEPDSSLDETIGRLQDLALRLLKYNMLQGLLLKALAYAQFKGDYSLIKYALEFNSPSDADATWASREILPRYMEEVLNVVSKRYIYEDQLMFSWEGHHGVRKYLTEVMLILFYNIRKRYEENMDASVEFFAKKYLRNDPNSIESLRGTLKQLQEEFSHHVDQATQLASEFFTRPEGNNLIKNLYSSSIQTLDDHFESLKIKGQIRYEVKEHFFGDIVMKYKEFNFLSKLFTLYGKPDQDIKSITHTIGVNQLHDREAFIDSWHIPYYGLQEAFGRTIAEQENAFALSMIRTSVAEYSKIDKSGVWRAINESKVTNKIVVSRNIYFDDILREADGYIPSWNLRNDENLIPNFYSGKLNNVDLFSYYDHAFGTQGESMLVIDKNLFGSIENIDESAEGYGVNDNFKWMMEDLAQDQELTEFLKKPPTWLVEEFKTEKDQRDLLIRKVVIKIFKQIKISVNGNIPSEGYIFYP